MKVGDVMTRFVDFVAGDAIVCEAAALMGEIDVGALPVGDADDLQGVLTDRDILFRVVAKCLDPATVRVRDIASAPVVGCGEEDALSTAMDTMAAHNVRRLAVRDDAGRVVGWVTLADLARRLLVESEPLQAELRSLTEAGDQLR